MVYHHPHSPSSWSSSFEAASPPSSLMSTGGGGRARRFACDACPKTFTLRSSLVVHQRQRHTGRYRYYRALSAIHCTQYIVLCCGRSILNGDGVGTVGCQPKPRPKPRFKLRPRLKLKSGFRKFVKIFKIFCQE